MVCDCVSVVFINFYFALCFYLSFSSFGLVKLQFVLLLVDDVSRVLGGVMVVLCGNLVVLFGCFDFAFACFSYLVGVMVINYWFAVDLLVFIVQCGLGGFGWLIIVDVWIVCLIVYLNCVLDDIVDYYF